MIVEIYKTNTHTTTDYIESTSLWFWIMLVDIEKIKFLDDINVLKITTKRTFKLLEQTSEYRG